MGHKWGRGETNERENEFVLHYPQPPVQNQLAGR